jgi:hypothetical protein
LSCSSRAHLPCIQWQKTCLQSHLCTSLSPSPQQDTYGRSSQGTWECAIAFSQSSCSQPAGESVPRGHLGTPGNIFVCHNWGKVVLVT